LWFPFRWVERVSNQKPRNELVDLELDEISLVDDPANARARVAVWKRAAPEEAPVLTGPQSFMDAIRKAFRIAAPEVDLTEVEKHLDDAEQALVEGSDEVEKMSAEGGPPMQAPAKSWDEMSEEERAAWLAANPGMKSPGVKKSTDTNKEEPVDQSAETTLETVAKADFEAVTKRLETAEAALAEVRKAAEVAEIRKSLGDLPKADELAERLQKMAADERAFFVDQATTAAAQLAAAQSVLTTQLGTARVAKAGGAEAALVARAEALAEEKGLPVEVAKGLVLNKMSAADKARLYEEAA
jgi:hypothetical protein